MRDIKPEDLIFIDETGINLALARIYARSVEGMRAYGERPHQRGQNVSLMGALSLKGFVGAMTVEGGTNGVVFRDESRTNFSSLLVAWSSCSDG